MSQFQRNATLIIGKDVTADATSLATLDSGEIIVLKENGSLLAAGETLADSASITIAVGSGDANAAATGYLPVFSNKIQGANVKRWTGQSYQAAVQQSSTAAIVAYGTGGNATADTTYSLAVIIKNDKVAFSERQLRKVFSTVVLKGNAITSAAVATAIYNNMVADPYFQANGTTKAGAYINVTDAGNGTLTLAGIAQTYKVIDGYEQVSFEITKALNIDGSTITYGTAPTPGSGTVAKLKDLERFLKTNRGITNFTKFPTPDAVSETDVLSTELYDIYVIEHDDVHPSADLNGQIASPCATYIAVPYDAAAGNGNALESILNPYFASCPGAFAAVNL